MAIHHQTSNPQISHLNLFDYSEQTTDPIIDVMIIYRYICSDMDSNG